MSEPELRELGEDIKNNGQKCPIVLWDDPENGTEYLLDGRNRLDAMELVGVPLFDENEHELFKWILSLREELDPYDLVLSFNVHRRHLTADQRTELVEKVLRAKPQMSDRAIAKQTKVDHKKVGKARTKLESTGAISPVDKRVGADGKARAKKKAANKKMAKPNPATKPRVTQSQEEISIDQRKAEMAALDGAASVDDKTVEMLPPAIEDSNPIWIAWCKATPAQRCEFVKLGWGDIERERHRATAYDETRR